MLGIGALAGRFGREVSDTVSTVVVPTITAFVTRRWEVRLSDIESKLAAARGELETLEATRRDLAIQAEDGIEGAQKRLDNNVRDIEKAKRRIEDLEAAREGVKDRLTDQQVRDAAAHRAEWQASIARQGVKLKHAAHKVDECLDALRDATDELTDAADALRSNLSHPARTEMADRFSALGLILGARLDHRRFGLKRLPFAADAQSFADHLNVDYLLSLAKYTPPAKE